jgi:hypothetical protein
VTKDNIDATGACPLSVAIIELIAHDVRVDAAGAAETVAMIEGAGVSAGTNRCA